MLTFIILFLILPNFDGSRPVVALPITLRAHMVCRVHHLYAFSASLL